MKKITLFITTSLCAALIGCQENLVPSETRQEENKEISEQCLPGMMRVQVSESLADKWLSEADEEGNVLNFDGAFFEGLDVKSVSTSFHIGGKFEKRQRAEGLHLWFDVVYSESIPATRASSRVASDPDVMIAEPVYKVKSNSIEMNDPHYLTYQWHYDNTGLYGFREGIDIGLQEVWDRFGIFGNSEVVVAVIDSGVDCTHEDLLPNMWVNEAELNGTPGVDDDGNGYKDDVYGYNFVAQSAEINPEAHGTHVAGTIGAANNNGIGVCGVAGGYYPDKPGVRIMALQVMDSRFPESFPNLVKVFQYAAENGAAIINNSWGYEQALKNMPSSDKQAIDYFVKNAGLDENGNQVGPMKGGLAIFAAGNEAEDLCYPAAYDKVMAVAAVGPNGKAAYYTNYGDWVEVCAPGGDHKVDATYGGVYSIGVNNTYVTMQGTSMACPHVTGIAALVLSASGGPGYTKDDLWNAVMEGTDPSIYDYNQDMLGLLGVGMVSAPLALSTLNTTPPENVTSVVAEVNANTIYMNADVPADDTGDAYYYHVYVSESRIDPSRLTSYERQDIAINKQTLMEDGTRRFAIKGLKFETDYHFAIVAGDFAGNMSEVPYMLDVRTNANTLPVITATTSGKTEIKSWEVTSYVFVAKELDDFHTVTCSFDPGDTGGNVLFEPLVDGSYLVRIDGSKFKEGSYRCWFTASDQYGGESRYEVAFTVEVNNAPVLVKTMDDVLLNGAGDKISVDLSDCFSDEDGETLMYTAVVADDKVASASVSGNTLNVIAKGEGITKITVTASDTSGESVSAEFKLLVRDGSKPYDLYPNPVVDVLNIRSGEEAHADITVVSQSGETVYSAADVHLGGFEVYQADLTALAPGRYNITITPASGESYKTIIVKL